MITTIIGLGLMGGSAAIDLKKRGFTKWIIGVDSNVLHAETALHAGIVDEIETLQIAVRKSDLIILAIPVDAAVKLLPVILDEVDKQIVTDMCSTKAQLSLAVKDHKKRKNYVAAHPMAGTEFSGPWAAKPGLFDGKAVIFCDTDQSGIRAISTVRLLYDTLNMRPVQMNAAQHDKHAAYVSHISHISSFALALTVLEQEKNEKNIFDLASGGFDSTVRLAKSSAEMWSPIFEQNADNVVTVIETYIRYLENFKSAIQEHDIDKITGLIHSSNKIKRVLS
jgi:prephenate dehydrogenase